MPELPSFNTQKKPSFDLTLAELTSAYTVLRNHVRVNESTRFDAGSHEAFQLLRIKSVVRKFEAQLDAHASNQLRSDAESSES